jgi:ribose 5-phosphate isomerase A
VSKQRAALAALPLVRPGSIVGVGTGSTVAFFIEALESVAGAVASSAQTEQLLRARGIPIVDLNDCDSLPLYVDGADEVDPERRLIKGAGGALTREKIVAAAAKTFACIVEPRKLVTQLGAAPLPVEVIPMARALVARELTARGGRPVWREDFITDNGGHILDVHGLSFADPLALERELAALPGVIEVGLFAVRRADIVLTGDVPYRP